MSNFLVLLAVGLISSAASAAPIYVDGLYVNSFGDPSNQALVFVHGGPGYDSQDFEWTTAEALAETGYFVLVYDQRGQGRSDRAQDPKVYSYQQYANDIRLIIQHFHLKKPTLLGHSHGGPISLRFDQLYPGLVGKVILISAPVNFWQSLNSLRVNCTSRYLAVGDALQRAQLEAAFVVLDQANSPLDDEITAVAKVFNLGKQEPCSLYRTKMPTADSRNQLERLGKRRAPVAEENQIYPMPNFLINENYIHGDQSPWVQSNASHIFGIYGAEDGLFTPGVLKEIEVLLATNPSLYRFQLMPGASHGVYIDQQANFIVALRNVLNDSAQSFGSSP